MLSSVDYRHMALAVRLADKGRFWARPNPNVGCVIASGDQVVGAGFTQPAGGDHAEVQALKDAGAAAKGCTAYVTLEPCAHQGRTPPCSQALITAGVARLVYAVRDPNPRVDGSGLAQLESAGIKVEQGPLAEAVERQLAGFLKRQRVGRPRVRVKVAMSLDGRTAMASGESQWITSPAARADVQRLRAESCAIVTGSGTVLADDCALTVRDENFGDELLPDPSRRATRVVLDSRGRIPDGAKVLTGLQPTLLITASDVASNVRVGHAAVALHEVGLDLRAVLDLLAERECNEVLVESGPRLAGAILREGLADQLIVYQAPKILGSNARPMLELPLEKMTEALELQLLDRRQIGVDQRLTFAIASRD